MRWTKEKCLEIAYKFDNKTDFKKLYMGAYLYALRKGILDEICSHMKIIGNKYKRCIYIYIFSDNHVYVGLTYNLERRNKEHLSGKKGSSVFKHILKTSLIPILIQLSDYINVQDAIKLEEKTLYNYIESGYLILNKTKTGAIGSDTTIWTKEKCMESAKLCKNTKEFKQKFITAYCNSYKNGWLREICSHMNICKPNGYWTKERCQDIALNYSTKKDFKLNDNAAYTASCTNKWIKDISTHMIEIIKPSGYWTKELCYEESLKYQKRKDFRLVSRSAYNNSKLNGWLDEFFPKNIHICAEIKESIDN